MRKCRVQDVPKGKTITPWMDLSMEPWVNSWSHPWIHGWVHPWSHGLNYNENHGYHGWVHGLTHEAMVDPSMDPWIKLLKCYWIL